MERHLLMLMRRHRELDREIEREAKRPAAGPRLRALKRLRLAMKDRIAAMQRRTSHQGA